MLPRGPERSKEGWLGAETDRKTKLGVGEGCPDTLEMGRVLVTPGENLPRLLSVNWKEHREDG